jgi:mersacidin/lichenicidin family type 2 lantibiotic
MAIDIKRALIDPEYRATLTPEELKQLPADPAGSSELTAEDLKKVGGGRIPQRPDSNIICTGKVCL